MFWNNYIQSMSKIEKIGLLGLIALQIAMVFLYFSSGVNGLTWRESMFSLILIVPWVLSIVMYLNFKQIPFHQSFINIRISRKERILMILKIIMINICIGIAGVYIIGMGKLFMSHTLISTLVMGMEVFIKYILFLFNISLVQCIGLSLFKNKGLITIILYLLLFMSSYTRNKWIVIILFSPLYPPVFNIFSIIITIGYFFLFLYVYLEIEKKKEYL